MSGKRGGKKGKDPKKDKPDADENAGQSGANNEVIVEELPNIVLTPATPVESSVAAAHSASLTSPAGGASSSALVSSSPRIRHPAFTANPKWAQAFAFISPIISPVNFVDFFYMLIPTVLTLLATVAPSVSSVPHEVDSVFGVLSELLPEGTTAAILYLALLKLRNVPEHVEPDHSKTPSLKSPKQEGRPQRRDSPRRSPPRSERHRPSSPPHMTSDVDVVNRVVRECWTNCAQNFKQAGGNSLIQRAWKKAREISGKPYELAAFKKSFFAAHKRYKQLLFDEVAFRARLFPSYLKVIGEKAPAFSAADYCRAQGVPESILSNEARRQRCTNRFEIYRASYASERDAILKSSNPSGEMLHRIGQHISYDDLDAIIAGDVVVGDSNDHYEEDDEMETQEQEEDCFDLGKTPKKRDRDQDDDSSEQGPSSKKPCAESSSFEF